MNDKTSKKILSLMYPELFTKYVETTGDKCDDKTFRVLRLIANSKYGKMGDKKNEQ